MRILVLAHSIGELKKWARQAVIGQDVEFREPPLRLVVDGTTFILRPYDMVDTVAGMRFNTVLHVGPIPERVKGYIRSV